MHHILHYSEFNSTLDPHLLPLDVLAVEGLPVSVRRVHSECIVSRKQVVQLLTTHYLPTTHYVRDARTGWLQLRQS